MYIRIRTYAPMHDYYAYSKLNIFVIFEQNDHYLKMVLCPFRYNNKVIHLHKPCSPESIKKKKSEN